MEKIVHILKQTQREMQLILTDPFVRVTYRSCSVCSAIQIRNASQTHSNKQQTLIHINNYCQSGHCYCLSFHGSSSRDRHSGFRHNENYHRRTKNTHNAPTREAHPDAHHARP